MNDRSPLPIAQRVRETVGAIRKRTTAAAQVGVILGSGLGGFAEILSLDAELAFEELPHFPCSTAPGHAGRMLLGVVKSGCEPIPLIVMQGRCHLYEGYCPAEITYAMRVLRAMGVERVILSCAAGGLAAGLNVGDLLVIEDHINLQFQQVPFHPDSSEQGFCDPYDAQSVTKMLKLAERLNIPARSGTYIGVTGPNYETRAELRWLRQIGTAVGMSTVVEASVARQMGMHVTAIATITNLCNPETPAATDGDHVVQAARHAEPNFRRLLLAFLGELHTGSMNAGNENRR